MHTFILESNLRKSLGYVVRRYTCSVSERLDRKRISTQAICHAGFERSAVKTDEAKWLDAPSNVERIEDRTGMREIRQGTEVST